jgi:hypothetical protein
MKPSAIRIERMLEEIEARLVPPPRKCLSVIIHEAGEDKEKTFAEFVARYPASVDGRTIEDLNWDDDLVGAQKKALAEHVARHPEDAGRTVEDFKWMVRTIVHRAQFVEDTDLSESKFEDADKDTDGPSETLRTGLDQAGSTPELDGKGGSHHNPEPIDLPPPDPGCPARSKPWRPVHQRPARDQRRPTWKKWE